MMVTENIEPILKDETGEAGEVTMMTPVLEENGGEEMTLMPQTDNTMQTMLPLREDDKDKEKHDTAFGIVNTGGGDDDNGEDMSGIKMLATERNLSIPTPVFESVDNDEPFSSVSMAGKWIREALDVRNYWNGIMSMGESVAGYKWAYDEGNLGEFDGKKFTKEALKAGVRSVASDSLRMTGNLLTMFGANLEKKAAATTVMTSGAGAVLPETGKMFQKLGQAFGTYAQKAGNMTFTAPDEAVYAPEPSWERLANVIGAGSAQVLAMGASSKVIGTAATYGLFAGAGAGEIFNETLEKSQDVAQANTLATVNAGVTFAIDRLFNPLPQMVEKGAKETSRLIASEILGAPLREAGSEVLQQMLAENLVRKVGLDDTQELFEGLIESAIGAMAGSGVLVGADSSVYLAGKTVQNVTERMIAKGAEQAEIELLKDKMLLLMEQNPQAFSRILGRNFERALEKINEAADKAGKDVKPMSEEDDAEAFREVREEMKKRFGAVLEDEAQADAAAIWFASNALIVYQENPSITPKKLLDGLLPKIEKTSFEAFRKRMIPEDAVSYMMVGAKAKKSDLLKLSEAYDMLKEGKDAQKVWEKTGWALGADDMMRTEISDKKAKLKLWEGSKAEEAETRYIDTLINKFDGLAVLAARRLETIKDKKNGVYASSFYKYLEENMPAVKWKKSKDGTETLRHDFSPEVLDEVTMAARQMQDEALLSIWKRYRDGEKLHDEEELFVKSVIEDQRYREFTNEYWNPKDGATPKMHQLAAKVISENVKNPDFIEALSRIGEWLETAVQSRKETAERLRLRRDSIYFDDLQRDAVYKQFRLYKGYGEESSDVPSGFKPQAYRKAYQPRTMGEKFLADEKFSYLSPKEKEEILPMLDGMEMYYRLRRNVKALETYLRKSAKAKFEEMRQNPDKFNAKERLRMQWRFVKESGLGTEFKLGEVLDHEELYENYPELRDAVVRFTRLRDGGSHHFYHDIEKGYVFEVDAEQVTAADLKRILLQGGAFAVQDIENFDYSLTADQRRNYMDRQIYLAKKANFSVALENFRDFKGQFLKGTRTVDYMLERRMPLKLVQMAQSEALDSPKPIRRRYDFYEVDYKKAAEDIIKRYNRIGTPDAARLKDLALWKLHKLESDFQRSVMATARAQSGYEPEMMPWAGEFSQGGTDMRYLMATLAGVPKSEVENYPQMNTAEKLGMMDAEEEFLERINQDRKDYQWMMHKMAKGAYDHVNHIVSLFKGSDIETIVHETVHYFWDLVESDAFKNKSTSLVFLENINTFRELIMRQVYPQKIGDKYYLLGKYDHEPVAYMQRGFDTAHQAVEQGVREYFAEYMVNLFYGRSRNTLDVFLETTNFYRRWMNRLITLFDIDLYDISKPSKKFIRFLKNKIK